MQHGKPTRTRRDASWWLTQVEGVAARYPAVHWKLRIERPIRNGTPGIDRYEGGRRFARDGMPTTWVLTDHKAGHRTQSIGLSEALGWGYEVKTLSWNRIQLLTDRLLGPVAYDPDGTRTALLRSPWPDLVISTGWRTAPIVRWVVTQSGGTSRAVQMGRKGGSVAGRFDLVVTCSHFRFPPHRRRVEITAPLTQVTAERLEQAAARWSHLFDGAPHPRIVLLVGGTSPEHRLDVATASRLGRDVAAFARAEGAAIFVVTSPRTGAEPSAALERALDGTGHVHRWRANDPENPYLGYLAGADALIVTGDSESMISEAVATGKPVYIYPVPRRRRGPARLVAEWITRRAYSRPRKKTKGTVRPQQGLEYICSRLIERGLVLPPRDLRVLHRELFELGVARPFGFPLETGDRTPLNETSVVAARIRQLMGCDDADAVSSISRDEPMAIPNT